MNDNLNNMLQAFSRFGSLMNRAKDADISEDELFEVIEHFIIEKEKKLTPEFIELRERKKQCEKLQRSIEYSQKELDDLNNQFTVSNKRYPKWAGKREKLYEKYADGDISDSEFSVKMKEMRDSEERDKKTIETYAERLKELNESIRDNRQKLEFLKATI